MAEYEALIQNLRSIDEYDTGYAKLIYDAADAIEELEKKLYCQDITTAQILDMYIPLFIPRWIPVKERLPDNQRPVLVCVPPYTDGEEEYIGYVGMAYFTYSPNGGFWCGTDGNIYGAIGFIHAPAYWMPLPEPPKEE